MVQNQNHSRVITSCSVCGLLGVIPSAILENKMPNWVGICSDSIALVLQSHDFFSYVL